MARGKRDGSRSAAIREVLTQTPKAKAKEVVELLSSKGVKVNAGLVYMVKGSMKSKAGRKRRKAARAADAGKTAYKSATSPVELIRKVKELADEAGGFKSLRELVDVLSD